jgi:hypothetical protein
MLIQSPFTIGEACVIFYAGMLLPFAMSQGTERMSPQQTGADFSVSANEVPVSCIVRGRDGRPVADMKLEEFVLLDDGKPRAIEHVWQEVSAPLTVGFVIDGIGARQDFLPEHHQALDGFLQEITQAGGQAFVVRSGPFSNKLTVDLTGSPEELRAGVAATSKGWFEMEDLGEPCRPGRPVPLPPLQFPKTGFCGGRAAAERRLFRIDEDERAQRAQGAGDADRWHRHR